MKFTQTTAIALVCTAGLGACSVEEFVPEVIDAAAQTVRTGPAGYYTFTYQPTSGSSERVLRNSSTSGWFYYPDTLTGIPSDFSVFLHSTEGYLLRGVTSDGGGEVIVVDNGGQLKRTDTAGIPVSGSATYSGTYGGIVVNGTRDLSPETIAGTASVDVNFADFEVSGRITNRVYDGSISADDVTLGTANLANGMFTGSTAGGDLNSAGLVAADGTYTGIIVGPVGRDIVGTVAIVHGGTSTFVENGGMILSQ
ncbi:MAG: hypothetical protein ACRBBK_14930 [Paracoccaceae bacterium]